MQQNIFFQSEYYFYADSHEHDFLSGSIKKSQNSEFLVWLNPQQNITKTK